MRSYLLTFALAVGLAAAAPQRAQPSGTPTTPAGCNAPVSTPTCSPGAVVDYVVVKDDTLTAISKKFYSGICNIATLNKIDKPDSIIVGQKLRIPTFACDPDNTSCINHTGPTATCVKKGSPDTYTVGQGDTFYLISQKLGITPESLMAKNKHVDPTSLKIGQEIDVPVCKE